VGEAKYLAATVQWLSEEKVKKTKTHPRAAGKAEASRKRVAGIRLSSEFHTTALPGRCNISTYGNLTVDLRQQLEKLEQLQKETPMIKRWNDMHDKGPPATISKVAQAARAQVLTLYRVALLGAQTGPYPRQPSSNRECPQGWWDNFVRFINSDKGLLQLVYTVRFSYPSTESIKKGTNNFADVRQSCFNIIQKHEAKIEMRREPNLIFQSLCQEVMERCFQQSQPGANHVQLRKVFSWHELEKISAKSAAEARGGVISLFMAQVEKIEFRTCNEYIRWAHRVARSLLTIQPSNSSDSLLGAWGVNMLAGQIFRKYGLVPSPNKTRAKKVATALGKAVTAPSANDSGPNTVISDFFSADNRQGASSIIAPEDSARMGMDREISQPLQVHCDRCQKDIAVKHVCSDS
jgi:hypothetical protein